MKLKAKRSLGLVFFPAFDWAISPTHPEREERLLYTQDQVMEEGLMDIPGIVEYRVRPATFKDIQRVHFCIPEEGAVTTESHLISAGGCLVAADAVLNKEVDCAFALVRPPGHHAMRVVHGNRGFCNINIEAIMIEYIRATYGVKRVAIVDTDCHHGDGTQDIYWHDPDVLFISLHQDGRTLYPGSGFVEEAGGPNAQGTTINIPLPPKTGEEGFLYVVEELVLPLLERFQPEIIVNSAGQDNHYKDPITNMNFSARGYARLTAMLKPHIAVLEGGYSVEDALPYVNVGIIMALAGLDFDHVMEPNYMEEYKPQSNEVTRYIKELVRLIKHRFLEGGYKRKEYPHGEIVTRARNIFYDTDGIHERQLERLRFCENCKGALSIDSTSSLGHHVLCVHIPVGACKECRETANRWFEEGKARSYTHCYLQDRDQDIYISA